MYVCFQFFSFFCKKTYQNLLALKPLSLSIYRLHISMSPSLQKKHWVGYCYGRYCHNASLSSWFCSSFKWEVENIRLTRKYMEKNKRIILQFIAFHFRVCVLVLFFWFFAIFCCKMHFIPQNNWHAYFTAPIT